MRIKTEKFMVTFDADNAVYCQDKCRRILQISNFTKNTNKYPKGYLDEYPNIVPHDTGIRINKAKNAYYLVRPGDEMKEEAWQALVKWIRLATERYRECRYQQEQLTGLWNGEETFRFV